MRPIPGDGSKEFPPEMFACSHRVVLVHLGDLVMFWSPWWSSQGWPGSVCRFVDRPVKAHASDMLFIVAIRALNGLASIEIIQ